MIATGEIESVCQQILKMCATPTAKFRHERLEYLVLALFVMEGCREQRHQ
jgi:hypothetical protein